MRIISLAIILLASSNAYAQQWTDVTLTTPSGFATSPFDGQPASPLNPLVEVKGCDAAGLVCATSGIGLQNFASTSYVNSQFSGLNAEFNTANGSVVAINNQIAGINSQISQISTQIKTATQLAAVAAAMRDAIPNAGDRYAVRVNMAAWNSEAAGSVGFSANIDNSLRLSVNYGRSRQQNMFSGGFNFSFN